MGRDNTGRLFPGFRRLVISAKHDDLFDEQWMLYAFAQDDRTIFAGYIHMKRDFPSLRNLPFGKLLFFPGISPGWPFVSPFQATSQTLLREMVLFSETCSSQRHGQSLRGQHMQASELHFIRWNLALSTLGHCPHLTERLKTTSDAIAFQDL